MDRKCMYGCKNENAKRVMTKLKKSFSRIILGCAQFWIYKPVKEYNSEKVVDSLPLDESYLKRDCIDRLTQNGFRELIFFSCNLEKFMVQIYV